MFAFVVLFGALGTFFNAACCFLVGFGGIYADVAGVLVAVIG